MQFASRQVRQSLARTGNRTLTALKTTTKQRYQETLNFMREWTEDLMERQNELQQQREQWYGTSGLQQTDPNKQTQTASLNIERLVKQQFFKRVESIYMKQLVMTDIDTSSHGKAQTSQEDSLNHTCQNNNTFNEDNSYFEQSGQQQDRSEP